MNDYEFAADEPAASIEWVDALNRRWSVELPPQRVVLRSGQDVIDVPHDRWHRDITIAPHGDGYLIVHVVPSFRIPRSEIARSQRPVLQRAKAPAE